MRPSRAGLIEVKILSQDTARNEPSSPPSLARANFKTGGWNMPATAATAPPAPAMDLFATGALALAGGASWYTILMRPIWAAAAHGPICGHASGAGPHCAACYGALALIGLGLTLLAARVTPGVAATTLDLVQVQYRTRLWRHSSNRRTVHQSVRIGDRARD
jgi:hypothetical protein